MFSEKLNFPSESTKIVNKKEAKNIINNRKGKGYKIFYIE
jgi:hypothetical protein